MLRPLAQKAKRLCTSKVYMNLLFFCHKEPSIKYVTLEGLGVVHKGRPQKTTSFHIPSPLSAGVRI